MKNITRIRKQVAVIANRINKIINDLSAAFRKAWQLVKGREIVSKIAGVTFGNRQAALSNLEKYEAGNVNVTLEREADNAHDSNAIKVNVSVGSGAAYHLGYIPKDLAAMLAPLLDKGINLFARFNEVRGGTFDKPNYGAVITVEM